LEQIQEKWKPVFRPDLRLTKELERFREYRENALRGRRRPMKEFHCGSLVPGCDWHTRHEEEAEVMRRAVEHMRETHGETIIRESMVDAIRSRIQKVRNAA
jgi:predicted small metal-binding protein